MLNMLLNDIKMHVQIIVMGLFVKGKNQIIDKGECVRLHTARLVIK